MIKDNVQPIATPLIAVTEDYLRAFAAQIAEDTRKQIEAENAAKEPELIPRMEVIKLLGVDSSTLWRWERLSYLTPVRLGCKVMYRRSDLNKLKGGI